MQIQILTKEKLAEICSYLLQGLTEEESCLLSDFDPKEFKEAKEKYEDVDRMVKKSKIKFKLAHLKEIQTKKSGNNSQWILEKLCPEEFGSKAKENTVNVNIISQIMESIQNGEQASRIQPKTRADFIAENEEKREEPILK